MKHLFFILIILCLLPVSLLAQKKIAGNYSQSGPRIQLNTDSTFKYLFRYCMYRRWIKGNWSFNRDTVYFHPVTIYDTVTIVHLDGSVEDAIILSTNEISERFTQAQYGARDIVLSFQDSNSAPEKLFFRKERLYEIENGKRLVKKVKSGLTNTKFNPWYSKIDSDIED